jgi:hypothetical protein
MRGDVYTGIFGVGGKFQEMKRTARVLGGDGAGVIFIQHNFPPTPIIFVATPGQLDIRLPEIIQ